jgi:hypothetical protein
MQNRVIAILLSLTGLALFVLLAGSAMAQPAPAPAPKSADSAAAGDDTGVVVDRRGRATKVFFGRPPWLEATPAPPLEQEPPAPDPARAGERPVARVAPAPAGEPPSVPAAPEPAARPEARPDPPAVVSLMRLRGEVSDYLQRRVPYRASLSPRGGILFAEVKTGSLPHRVGLRTGDRVVAVNGQRVGTADAAMEAYLHLRPGKQLTLQVVRGAQQMKLELRIAS